MKEMILVLNWDYEPICVTTEDSEFYKECLLANETQKQETLTLWKQPLDEYSLFLYNYSMETVHIYNQLKYYILEALDKRDPIRIAWESGGIDAVRPLLGFKTRYDKYFDDTVYRMYHEKNRNPRSREDYVRFSKSVTEDMFYKNCFGTPRSTYHFVDLPVK